MWILGLCFQCLRHTMYLSQLEERENQKLQVLTKALRELVPNDSKGDGINSLHGVSPRGPAINWVRDHVSQWQTQATNT